MATKAAQKPPVPAVRKGSTAVVNYQELMAKQVAEIQNKLGAPGGDRITVSQDKKFKFPDGRVSSDPFRAVIVEFASGNFFWPQAFNQKNIVPPDCFALGADPKDMWPSDNSPKMQCKDGCNACPNNQFGSDGDGKACKNMRLLALLPPDADADTPFSVLHVSPTALRPFDGYIAKLAGSFGKPAAAFVTEIGFDPKLDYASLRFGNPEPVDDDKLGVFLGRQEEAMKRLLTEPDLSSYEARATKQGRSQAKPARR
jgi:hypothetical protein